MCLFLKVSPLPYFVATQLRAEIAMQVDLGGNIPSFVSHTIEIEFLSEISLLRRTFLRDFEFDQGKRRKLIVSMDRVQEVYSDTEKQDINSGKQIQQLFNRKETKKYSIETSNPAIVGVRAHVENESYCRLTTTVRCSGEEAFSFFWNAESRALRSEREYKREIITHDELEEQDKGPHSQVLHVIEKATSSSKANTTGFKTRRETITRMVWKKQNQSTRDKSFTNVDKRSSKVDLAYNSTEKTREDEKLVIDSENPTNPKKISFLIVCKPAFSSARNTRAQEGKKKKLSLFRSNRNKSSKRKSTRNKNQNAQNLTLVGEKTSVDERTSSVEIGNQRKLSASNRRSFTIAGHFGNFSTMSHALGFSEMRIYLDKQNKSSIHIIEVAQDEVKIEVFLNLLMTRRMLNHKIVSQVVTEKHGSELLSSFKKCSCSTENWLI